MNDNIIKRPLINRIRFGSTKPIVPDASADVNKFHKQIIKNNRFDEIQSLREASNVELIKQQMDGLIDPVDQDIKTKSNVPPANSKIKKKVTNLQNKRTTKKSPMTKKPPISKRKHKSKLPPKKNEGGMFKQIKDKFTGNPKDSNKNN